VTNVEASHIKPREARSHVSPELPTVATGGLDPLFTAYLLRLERAERDSKTICNVRSILTNFQRWLDAEGIPAASLTFEQAEGYFAGLAQAHKQGTVRVNLANIRAAYVYAMRRGIIAYDPTVDVLLAKPKQTEPETFSNAELRAILAEIRTEVEDLGFHLLAYGGLRRGEAIGLNWTDVDFANERLKVNGKGGKFRLVPIHPELAAVLRSYQEAARPKQVAVIESALCQRIHTSTFGDTMRALLQRAGVEPEACCHVFRKTVATALHEAGTDALIRDRILGWASRSVGDRYYTRVTDHRLYDAILTLYREDPITIKRAA
jgi:integrase/recombinase XerD